MRILGIDPALAAVGYSLVWWDELGAVLQEYDTLETPPKTAEGSRLTQIRTWLESFLDVRQPHLVVMERPFFHGKLAYNSLPLGMAYGVILETCTRAGVRVAEVVPRDVKYTVTGNTSAKKPQMRAAVSQILGVPLLKGKDDGVDAVAIALTWIIKEQKEQEELARVR